MRWKNTVFVLFALLGGFQFSLPAQANECLLATWSEFDYRTAFESTVSSPCYHVENNNSTLGGKVNILLAASEPDARSRALLAMDTVQVFLVNTFDGRDIPQSENAAALHTAIQSLKQSLMANPNTPEPGIKAKWKLGQISMLPEALEHLNFDTTLRAPECDIVGSGNCDTEFELATDVVKSIFLINAALDKYTEDYRAEVYADRKIRRTKWDSYYDDLTFQYPWELWANNLILEATDHRAKIDGNKVGFRILPRSKLVALHPEVNLVYADGAEDEYDVTVTVEMLGYEGFDFNRSGKIKNSWGVSLLAAYLPRADRVGSSWTAGLLFKYAGYSLGVTDNHGETGIVFNVNLSQRIFDVKENSRRYYDEYKGQLDAIRQSFE